MDFKKQHVTNVTNVKDVFQVGIIRQLSRDALNHRAGTESHI